jgi:hypothetical protein
MQGRCLQSRGPAASAHGGRTLQGVG